ncbi:MAG: helix-hairpin-helix domain-containing protein [Bacteroidales bacterium]|nr:helix-hairpin-helix domain-containing protein [Bacteroidales bacterium]
MDNFKRFMTFSRGERIAIITIVSIIVIILIAKYLIISNPPKRTYFFHDLDSIIERRNAMLDSIRIADSIEKQTAKQNQIPRYARNDRAVISSEPRAKREGNREISEISPLPAVGRNDVLIDINTADTTLLKQLPGIGGAYAKWIVEYREKLGGYCETEQLLEIYRMDTTRYNEFKNQVKIDSTFIPKRLRINSDTFKVLLKHPYLEFDDVKKIVNHREQKGMIASWEQLVKVVGDAINPKLQYYIDYQ